MNWRQKLDRVKLLNLVAPYLSKGTMGSKNTGSARTGRSLPDKLPLGLFGIARRCEFTCQGDCAQDGSGKMMFVILGALIAGQPDRLDYWQAALKRRPGPANYRGLADDLVDSQDCIKSYASDDYLPSQPKGI